MGIIKKKMKIFVKNPANYASEAIHVEDACLVADLKDQIAMSMNIDEEFDLQYGIQTLGDETFLEDAAQVSVHFSLDGGKKKRKRKPHTTPKKIKHKHKKRPKALLAYFSVEDGSMKVKRLKQESPQAAGSYMADHPDRYVCGRTGTMFYKLTPQGERLPIPKQNKQVVAKAEKVVEVKKKLGKKGKK